MHDMRRFMDLTEDLASKIKALRMKTVANGATPGEEASAQAMADKLETKRKKVAPKVMPDDEPSEELRSTFHNAFSKLGFSHAMTIGADSDNPMHIYRSTSASPEETVAGLRDLGFYHVHSNPTEHVFQRNGHTVKFRNAKGHPGGILYHESPRMQEVG